LLLTFGSFSFEFARRVIYNAGQDDRFNYGHWSAKDLGKEFKNRLDNFDIKKINIIPLLHRSISGGRFNDYHVWFCNPENSIISDKEGEPNYFNYVGEAIAKKLLSYKDALEIWIE
jgi:hypothetical protein